jgi:beta-glucosidase/6-phospho-beta-glucosidase/beta-galactosidase
VERPAVPARHHHRAAEHATLDLVTSSASPVRLFQSFFLGGFECATHRRRDNTRIDVLATSHHDTHTAEDYQLLAQTGIRTVRDGLRWHLIERSPGLYDWSSFLPMLDASLATGTQVLWDLCHWGTPDGLDPFSSDFPPRFAAFAAAAATLVRDRRHAARLSDPPLYCAVNEISFWSWVGGDVEHFHPFATGRGAELKRNLIRASIAAIRAIRAVDSTARFLQPEPIIRITADPAKPQQQATALAHSNGQFEAWDMLAGLSDPDLGGSPDLLDIIGANFYWDNEWIHGGEHTPPGHPLHHPLHLMLVDLWQRYRRPILLSETGTEAETAVGWLDYIAAEVRQAQRLGVPILGICLYPITDYPGWDDGRHCPCGLIELSADYTTRKLRSDLLTELKIQQPLFASSVDLSPTSPTQLP